MKEYQNQYTRKIYDVLVPLVGSLVAQSVIKLNAAKIGKSEETLAHSDGPKIIDSIKKGLTTFIGTEAAGKVASKLGEIY